LAGAATTGQGDSQASATPPAGQIEPKRRAPRPFPGQLKGPQGGRVWKPEELALLGTVPDREVVARLGSRSYLTVIGLR
jgi:hypothetical protein